MFSHVAGSIDFIKPRALHLLHATLSRTLTGHPRLPIAMGIRWLAAPSSTLTSGVTLGHDSTLDHTTASWSVPARKSRWTTTALTLLTLLLFVSITTSCGGGASLTGGGEPLSIIAHEALELEIYSVETYLSQDLPDELREDFTAVQEDLARLGVDFENVDQFVRVILSCCSYRKVDSAPGPRVYVLDGPVDLDAVRDSLEDEGFGSRMSGDIEAWEKRALAQEFRGHDNFAAAFLTEEGYVVMGAIDGIREVLFELDRASEDDETSAMEQVITRLGTGWKTTGRLDAQTSNTLNTHCAQSVRHRQRCSATAHFTDYSGSSLRTEIVALYSSAEDAQSESERLESNFEESGEYYPIDIEVVDLKVEGEFVDATIEHDIPLRRFLMYIY